MSTQSRKQREIQEREALILDWARPRIAAEGYLQFHMGDVAEAMEYSRGTIYKHFPHKEEIILALAIQTMQERVDLFRKAATFQGLTRERIHAVGMACEIFYRLHPEHFGFEQLIRSRSIWDKTTAERRLQLRGCESHCMGVVSGVVRDAIAQGDLSLPEGTEPEHVVFGLWGMTFGTYSIMAGEGDSLQQVGIEDPYQTLRENQARLLDGYGWRPLSHEHDYPAVIARIQSEVFADEHHALSS